MIKSLIYVNTSTLNQFFGVFQTIWTIPPERFLFIIFKFNFFFSRVIELLLLEKTLKYPRETQEIIETLDLKKHFSLEQTQTIIEKIIISAKNSRIQKFFDFIGMENPKILNVYSFH